MNKRDAYFVEFVKNNSSSFASLAVAEQLPPDNNLELLKTLADGLAKTNPNSEYVVTFQTRVNELSKIAVGTIAPEIALNSPEAKVIKLSELRGKYVLIDFWASWCKPCREENPNVKKVYEKYKSKGFEIYGVSVESIKKDQINWLHVSDLGFWNSSVVKQYNISGIPLTVLIDKEGKIIAKNLRGQSLEAKLAEIFGI
jgi:thiol-disulfide isomerase/thioredoxin